MANNYQLFSVSVASYLTDDQKAWLHHNLKDYEDMDDVPDDDAEESDDWHTVRPWIEAGGDRCSWPDFSFEYHRGHELIFYTDESGSIDSAAEFIKAFLNKFRPDEYVILEYANTCSSPRVGEFCGGAVLITGDMIKNFDPSAKALKVAKAWEKRNGISS
jgi:hypothetical protein